MKMSILPLALGIALAFAGTAYATETPYNQAHHPRATNTAALTKAQLRERHLRHEGLSRNRSDCVKYGCLGY